ncbi:MAG: aldo/keto reductase [Proteobacteria bacterium]|nr:aldo/keto reductase [Pseudomonadota bacterium]
MLYRKVPKSGDELSILGYGCMRLPLKRGRIDEKRATRQLREAIDRGVNYIDTAQPYHMGASEPFLGRALRDGYREKVRLATKQFSLKIRSTEDFTPHLGAQLKKLQTDYLDYYLLHGISGPVFERMKGLGVLEFLEQAKKDGRIRSTGFSFHGDLAAFKEIVDAYDWDICQIQYNYIDENIQAGTEGLKYAAAKRLGVIVM